MTSFDAERAKEAVGDWLSLELDAPVRVETMARLGGGAIQENWSLDVRLSDRLRRWVLRTDAASGVAVSRGKAEEFKILQVVHGAGVTVPEPIALCEDPGVLGASFYVMVRHPGEARGRVLVRDPQIERWGPGVVEQLARELATLHRIEAPVPALPFIEVPKHPPRARVAEYRRHLAAMQVTNPVLDLALDVLDARAPATARTVLIHADFRLGNVLIDEGRLSAVLDWEFAGYGDPLEDLGWFLGRFWRFGRWHQEAGGMASKQQFVAAYSAASGSAVDDGALLYWQLMGTVRWAVIALQQAARHFVDGEPSLELALTGAVLPQLEWDLLDLIEALDGHR